MCRVNPWWSVSTCQANVLFPNIHAHQLFRKAAILSHLLPGSAHPAYCTWSASSVCMMQCMLQSLIELTYVRWRIPPWCIWCVLQDFKTIRGFLEIASHSHYCYCILRHVGLKLSPISGATTLRGLKSSRLKLCLLLKWDHLQRCIIAS